MADWEDEEDAFLYGGSSAAPAASTSTAGAVNTEAGATQAQGNNANPVLSMHEQSTVEAVDEGEGEADMDEEPDEEEDEEEEEESDDDFQIIMDSNAAVGQAAHHDMARKAGPIPVRPPVPSLVRDLPRQDSQPSGRLPDRADSQKPPPASGPSNPLVSLQTTIHPTGSPIPAPSRLPPPDLNDTSATYNPTRKDELESRPEPQPIVDVDLDSIEDKKWRKPGAYLSDYFNYGFDEATWKEWCAKQHSMRKDRDREREHPFHVFADMPLPEAWASLPMELKGLMMQTIMSSFNGASGPQQQQQQQMMQGMMPQGMGGMQGMPPNMQGNPMNMGGMPMGGMPMGGMNMMGGPPGQQQRGMNGGFGGPGMQQQQNRGR